MTFRLFRLETALSTCALLDLHALPRDSRANLNAQNALSLCILSSQGPVPPSWYVRITLHALTIGLAYLPTLG